MNNQHHRAASYPAPTAAARRRSSTRIAAVLIPTEPSAAEVARCEARLELTAMRARCTVPARRAS